MYHACKVNFQPFNRMSSPLTFSNFDEIMWLYQAAKIATLTFNHRSFCLFLLLLTSTFQLLQSLSGQVVVTGVVPSAPRFLPSIFIAQRVQQSHCSSIFHRVLLTHALALSASQIVRKKKSHTNLYEYIQQYTLGGIRTYKTDLYLGHTFFFVCFRTLLLSSFWTSRGHRQASTPLPPGSCLQFLSRIGFSTLTARRFLIECR